jgi:hypothetical protein
MLTRPIPRREDTMNIHYSKTHVVFLLVFLLAVWTLPAQAQDTPIEYGDTVTGEITARTFEVGYVFEGVAGDVIIILIEGIDTDEVAEMDQPAIILLDSDYAVMGSVDGYLDALLAAQLPADGEYTVLASRRDGRGGESVGGYELTLLKLDVLEDAVAVQAVVSSMASDYYAVESEGQFAIEYTRAVGEFSPTITIYVIDDEAYGDNNLDDLATLSGDAMVHGTLGVNYTSNLYIVSVGTGLFDYSWREEVTEYSLTYREEE